MGEVITIGLDIAKSVFQVHGVDEAGAAMIRKRITDPWREVSWDEALARAPTPIAGIDDASGIARSLPRRVEMNTMRPSGRNRGAKSLYGPSVS